MAFDIERLAAFSISAIRSFAESHRDETFYAFAIDADMLCLNSDECASATLRKYRERWKMSTREIQSWSSLTEADMKQERFALDLAAKHSGLDLRDHEASLLVINRSRARRRDEGCLYDTEVGIRALRENTGDWEYQGFAHLRPEHGFDRALYDDHYEAAGDSEDGHAPETEYATAMSRLVAALEVADAFSCLKRSPEFKATWVDHDY
jgi:hypothetical protein